MVLAGMLGYGPAPTGGQTPAPVSPAVGSGELNATLIVVVSIVLLLLTPLYLWRVSKVTNGIQIAVTTLSFVVWVYTLGGPFVVWGIYHSIIASVVLVLWSAIIAPLITPAKS